MRKTHIYYLHDPDGKLFYIGKSIDPARRFKRHIYDVDLGSRLAVHDRIRKIIKTGNHPKITIVAESFGDGCAEEIEHIAKAMAAGIELTNGTLGGDGAAGHKPSAELLAQRSAYQKRLWADPEYYNKYAGKSFLGKHHSKKTRKKWSELRKGKKLSPDHAAKMAAIGAANKGKKRSPESVEKGASKLRGRKVTNIFVYAKILKMVKTSADNRRGKPLSEETKAKFSAARKGRPSKFKGVSYQSSAAHTAAVRKANSSEKKRSQMRAWHLKNREERREIEKPIIADYIAGMPPREVERKHGIHKRGIYPILKAHGVPTQHPEKNNRKLNPA